MRQIALLALAAALILFGIGKWNVKAINEPAMSAGVDTFGLMATANDLPKQHYDDYSLVFN